MKLIRILLNSSVFPILACALLLLIEPVSARQTVRKKYRGTVISRENEPVIGASVSVKGGAGTVTIAALAGVTLRTPNGSSTSAQYDARGIEYLGSNEWRVW